jgi:Zn-dependent protease/predicted transcriptional regulator
MFTKRWNFLTFQGIRIGIDASWIFIALLITWTLAAGHFPFAYPGFSVGTYWLMGFIGMVGLFVCILLHELGHAVVAKHFQIPVSQITLFLFGGVAELKKEPSSPKVEFLIAIAGPLVTLVLSLFFSLLTHLGESKAWPTTFTGITSYLAAINAIILLFNLIPAFPLDGGRVLRAILWAWKKNLEWATKIAAKIGTAFGFFLIFFGIFLFIGGNFLGGIWMAIIGLFLQKASFSSQTQLIIGKELQGAKVSSFMKKNPDTVPSDITVEEFIDKHVYRSHHHLYPVIQEDHLLGYISLKEVKSIPSKEWGFRRLDSALVPLSQAKILSPDTSALEAMRLMQEEDVSSFLVVEKSHLVGLLTASDLFKVIALKLELKS